MTMVAPTPNDPWSYLWERGYRRLIPIVRNDKRPAIDDWTNVEATEALLDIWRERDWGIGIVGGYEAAAVDADCYLQKDADIARPIIDKYLPNAPIRVGREPKALHLFRPIGFVPYSKFEFGKTFAENDRIHRPRIEVLSGGGRQFVVYGTHPVTQRAYHWARRLLSVDELPALDAAGAADLMAELAEALPDASPITRVNALGPPPDQDSLRGDAEAVTRAVRAIPNEGAAWASRESYLDLIYAVKAALGDDEQALTLVLEWTAHWKDGVNDPEVVKADFRRAIPPYRRGANWLYELAAAAAPGHFNIAEPFLDSIETIEAESALFPQDSPVESAALDLSGTVYDFPAPSSLPPRQFLYGFHYQRQYISATIAPTKVGKTSLSVSEALAMVSGKPLLGVAPTGLWRVRLWNGEDPREELERHIAATMQEYGLTAADVGDRLLADSGRDMPICTALQVRDGVKIMAPVVSALSKSLADQAVDVLIIDPFIKSHGVSENDNMAIDKVAEEWNRIAGANRVAIDLIHHSRKLNGGEASIDDARGASALVSAARAARVLARMTKGEGQKLGKAKEYRRFFRFVDAVSNMAPATVDDTWLELKSVDLGNAVFGDDGRLLWPSDKVGVVRLSGVTGAAEAEDTDESARMEAQAIADLAGGEWREDVRSRGEWAGVVVARAYGLDLDEIDDRERAKAILKALVKSGKLITEIRKDPISRKQRIYIQPASAASVSLEVDFLR